MLVQERFKGHEKIAEDSLRGTKFSQNKIKCMNFFTKKMRGSKEMGRREKMIQAGTPLINVPPLILADLSQILPWSNFVLGK